MKKHTVWYETQTKIWMRKNTYEIRACWIIEDGYSINTFIKSVYLISINNHRLWSFLMNVRENIKIEYLKNKIRTNSGRSIYNRLRYLSASHTYKNTFTYKIRIHFTWLEWIFCYFVYNVSFILIRTEIVLEMNIGLWCRSLIILCTILNFDSFSFFWSTLLNLFLKYAETAGICYWKAF